MWLELFFHLEFATHKLFYPLNLQNFELSTVYWNIFNFSTLITISFLAPFSLFHIFSFIVSSLLFLPHYLHSSFSSIIKYLTLSASASLLSYPLTRDGSYLIIHFKKVVRITCAGTLCVYDTCVETFWFRRNVWKPAVRLFLRMGPIIVSSGRKVA